MYASRITHRSASRQVRLFARSTAGWAMLVTDVDLVFGDRSENNSWYHINWLDYGNFYMIVMSKITQEI
jgi:hypothetical protein